MKKFRISLLWQVLIAIATGIALGQFLPVPVARIFVTFNGLFGNFLTFAIPLIIIGLIIPAISDLGKGAGRLRFHRIFGILHLFQWKSCFPGTDYRIRTHSGDNRQPR